MYVNNGGELVLSPTDLTKHLACEHLTQLDLAVARGERPAPDESGEELELLFQKGIEHEQRHLDALKAEGRLVVEIGDGDLDEQVAATEAALRAGAAVVYQAAFRSKGRRGHADFVTRVDEPSLLGDWSYEVADTKLARRLKVPALLQLAEYAEHLEQLQGRPPRQLTVVTGDGAEQAWASSDVSAFMRRVRARLEAAVRDRPATRPEPVEHCGQCRFAADCARVWRREDHLSLVAFMRRDHQTALEESGIATVAALAAVEPDSLPAGIGRPSRERLVSQARLQMQERTTRVPVYELLAPQERLGLLRLPEPDPGDVYLDFEGDPFAEDGDGREYLAGLWTRDGDYLFFEAHSREQEAALTADLVGWLLDRWERYPGMHVYHYAPYEKSALARLTARHGVAEAGFDQLLRRERLVDLYAVVRQGMRISKESYSIKKLEAFYWGRTRGQGDVADALSSVLEYERFLLDGDPARMDAIRDYNRDDVRSTHDLHTWLEERRAELEAEHGVQPRPVPSEVTAARPLSDGEQAEIELAEELDAAGHPVFAGLVGWHRREARPAWWEVFRLDGLTDEELVADPVPIGDVSAPVLDGQVKRSNLWRYTFPPQDTKVREGEVWDVDQHKKAGNVWQIDAAAGWLTLKVGRDKPTPQVRGFGPQGPIRDQVLRDSLRATGRELLDGGRPLGARLVAGEVPAALPVQPGESAVHAVLRVGRSLSGEVLAVQGPPGAGKTTVGAELIRALLDAGLRVGVTAQSHAVVGNLLKCVGRPALQRCDEDQHCGDAQVAMAGSTAQVVAALEQGTHNLVGGSAWLWAHEAMAGRVDVLVVDEAGQFSLANAVAVSRAARSMVLLGDPQQLAQPSQAVHPPGADASALGHLLGGAAVLPPESGVFLDRTWRMHPGITRFVSDLAYDGKLESVPGLERQRISGTGSMAGSGLRWLPVGHRGNASASTEEAEAVGELHAALVGGRWEDADGETHYLGIDDVLVVAPYNAHVARLREHLPAGARVGTVDKFQGQQAPVVIYSLASSSAEDAPRGVGFLCDLHRLNVAVSRARALTVVVASPALLDAPVHSPEQLRRVNALCRFTELADDEQRATSESTDAGVPASALKLSEAIAGHQERAVVDSFIGDRSAFLLPP